MRGAAVHRIRSAVYSLTTEPLSETSMRPPDAKTIPDLLDELAARYPDQEALVSGEVRYTYRELRDAVRRLAKGLHALGVRRGDKVGILMGNRPEWLLADFAIVLLGGTMVAINTWATGRELGHVLRHSDTKFLITVDRFLKYDYLATLDDLERDGDALAGVERVVRVGGPADHPALPFDALWSMAETVDDVEIDRAQAAVQGEDVAYLLYTSGTTALPKGVQLQHFALIENMWNIGERQHLRAGDRLWLAVSLFWGLGCENALFAVMTHACCVVLQEHFDAGEALRLIEAERCTIFYGTPNMTTALERHPDRATRDISSLRTGATLGSPEQVKRLIDLGVTEICNIYGLTETYGNCTVTDVDDPLDRRLNTVGRALPGNEILIADPASLVPRDTGEVGEVLVKGYVTVGYYKDADLDARTFHDGYFRTGDLGLLDDAGFLHFRGRLKEMIKTGGINVSPAEVEAVLAEDPTVELAYVIGLPDPERDQRVAAVIVGKEGPPPSAEALVAHCAASLAAYKVPRDFRFVDAAALPLTTTGKLQKARLVEFFRDAAGKEASD
jgi:fatty-acyl-CoA synthase